MIILKQSTASQNVLLGPFVDSTDGVTPENSLTIANTDIKLFKGFAATSLTNKTSGGATYITSSNGLYYCTLDATDTNTVGPLFINVYVSGALPIRLECWVIEEAIYDALYGASATGFNSSGQVAVASIAADAITATAIASNAITSAKIATDAIGAAQIAANAIGASELAADAAAEIADAVWDEAASGHTTAGTFGQRCGADIDAILVDTNALNDTKVPDTISLASINAQVDTALADYDPPTRAEMDAGQSILAGLMTDIQGATFDTATDSLEAIRNRGDAAWTTGSGSGLTPLASGTAQGGTASTIQLAAGETFGDDILNGCVVKIISGTGAGQARVITDYTSATDTATVTPNWTTNPSSDSVYEIVEGTMNLAAIGGDAQSAADLKDFADAGYDPGTNQVEGVKLVDTTTTNTDMVSAAPSAAAVADAVWDEAKAGHVGAGSFGEEVQAHALSSEISALNNLSAAEVNVEVDTALADYDAPTKAEMDAGFAALNDPTAAAIADAVWDEAAAGHVGAGSFGEQCGVDLDAILVDTADMQPKLGTPAGASMSADIAALQADLPVRITKNTAHAGFMFFMADSTDHVTPKTGLTITAERAIDGASFASCANSASEVGDGWYTIDLAAGDLNGDFIALKFSGTGADQTNMLVATQST